MIEINWHPSERELRQFAGIWWPLFGLLVSFWLWKFEAPTPAYLAVIGIVAVTAVAGLWRPKLVRPVFVGWMWAALPIGWLVSHAMLAAVFYLLITPIGWFLRLTGRDPLDRQLDRNASTYWRERHEPRDESRYFKQY